MSPITEGGLVVSCNAISPKGAREMLRCSFTHDLFSILEMQQ
jgi:hypothetical protein